MRMRDFRLDSRMARFGESAIGALERRFEIAHSQMNDGKPAQSGRKSRTVGQSLEMLDCFLRLSASVGVVTTRVRGASANRLQSPAKDFRKALESKSFVNATIRLGSFSEHDQAVGETPRQET